MDKISKPTSCCLMQIFSKNFVSKMLLSFLHPEGGLVKFGFHPDEKEFYCRYYRWRGQVLMRSQNSICPHLNAQETQQVLAWTIFSTKCGRVYGGCIDSKK